MINKIHKILDNFYPNQFRVIRCKYSGKDVLAINHGDPASGRDVLGSLEDSFWLANMIGLFDLKDYSERLVLSTYGDGWAIIPLSNHGHINIDDEWWVFKDQPYSVGKNIQEAMCLAVIKMYGHLINTDV